MNPFSPLPTDQRNAPSLIPAMQAGIFAGLLASGIFLAAASLLGMTELALCSVPPAALMGAMLGLAAGLGVPRWGMGRWGGMTPPITATLSGILAGLLVPAAATIGDFPDDFNPADPSTLPDPVSSGISAALFGTFLFSPLLFPMGIVAGLWVWGRARSEKIQSLSASSVVFIVGASLLPLSARASQVYASPAEVCAGTHFAFIGTVIAQREYAVSGSLAPARTAVSLKVEAVAYGEPPPTIVVLLEGGLRDHRSFSEQPEMRLGSRYLMLTGGRMEGPVPPVGDALFRLKERELDPHEKLPSKEAMQALWAAYCDPQLRLEASLRAQIPADLLGWESM